MGDDFRRVAERDVHQGHVWKVVVAEFEGPEGQHFARDIVRSPGAVGVVPLVFDAEGRKKRHSFHRVLFRHGEKEWLVSRGNLSAIVGLAGLMLASSGALWLIFDVVTSRLTACVVVAVALALFTTLWWGVPLSQRRRGS